MTAQTTSAQSVASWLALNAQKMIKVACLLFVALASFALAFTHMHDWTREAMPNAAEWMCWANAVVSEILPTMSFIILREREDQGRPTRAPLLLFLGSVVLSIFAQLSATGFRIPYDAQLLACLPAIALFLLAKMAFGDLSYTRKAHLARMAEAEHRAELDRRRAEHQAELHAEQARNFEREQAEKAAEEARFEREQAAELERRRIEIEQAAMTERARIDAEERAEVRRAQFALEQRETEARLAREAEAARIAAEAERIRVEVALREQTAALLTVSKPEPVSAPPAGGNVRRIYRPREESQRIASVTLAGLPAGTTRDEAVKLVAAALGVVERRAREFVPADWTAGSSAGGEVGAA